MHLFTRIVERVRAALASTAVVISCLSPCPAMADIFVWEWVDPLDHSLGKRESTVLAPDGAGLVPGPGIDARSKDFTQAFFIGADLTGARFFNATLADADFTNAVVREASFINTTSKGFTADQLYSTASYQSGDLTGIRFDLNDLSGWNFSGQNLTRAYFYGGFITNTDLTGANITDANLSEASIWGADLSNAVLHGADLRNVTFNDTTLTGADFMNAMIRGTQFNSSAITSGQLYSTSSYKAGELSGIRLADSSLTGWNLAGQNLTDADFSRSELIGADFSGADLTNTYFTDSNLSNANLEGANLGHSSFSSATLPGANLRYTNLSHAYFGGASLTNVDITNSNIVGADFSSTTDSGFSPGQLYTSASYQARNLAGIWLRNNDLSGWNFVGQDLTGALFEASTLINTEFTNAEVRRAFFSNTTLYGFTAEQLYATASYQEGDLTGIHLARNSLSGWDFAGKNLTDADLSESSLHNADFTNADIREARMWYATVGGFTVQQLYSTSSYQQGDLTGLDLSFNNLSGWDFAELDLTNTRFSGTTLTGTDFTNSEIHSASFNSTTDSGFTADQLYATYSYQQGDLDGIDFGGNDLTSWNFAGMKLNNSSFDGANLTNAVFADAEIRGASFVRATIGGFTRQQLYTTASYRLKDLSGINWRSNDLAGWIFVGQDLSVGSFWYTSMSNADFSNADLSDATFFEANFADADLIGANLMNVDIRSTNLTGTNLSGADARGAFNLDSIPGTAITQNFIDPFGDVQGLYVREEEVMRIRDFNYDYSMPISVCERLLMDSDGVLRMEFEDPNWGSTISFDPGIPITLAGTLDLIFVDVDPTTLVGTTFDLFNWTGVAPVGTFDTITSLPGAVWDTSGLYTTGDVTLLSYTPWSVGDFNADGAVDGRDFLAWQRGESPDPFSQADLDAWHAGLGAGAIVSDGSMAVPEPGVGVLIAVALWGLAGARRQQLSDLGTTTGVRKHVS